MSPKHAKKPLWIDCEKCGCSIMPNDKNIHVELNCEKNQLKCPYIQTRKLYSWLETSGSLPEGAPKNAVLINPSTAILIGAVIGMPLLLSRDGAPMLVRQMWPSKVSSPSTVVLSSAELTGTWCNRNDKNITVSILSEETPVASKVTFKVVNHKIETNICDILKHHFYKFFISVGTILVYNYFGKKLDIAITEIKESNRDKSSKNWYVSTHSTIWNNKEVIVEKVKENVTLGGVDDILTEIRTLINTSFDTKGLTANGQQIRSTLLYGHSGVGKTAICKYLVETSSYYHIEINGSVVFSKYFGETENIIKTLFSKAIQNEPCIIFLDDIETICPRRSSSSTEQERRVTSAFVSILDSLREDCNKVFILATTKNTESLDPMLRRFGRLDKEIEIPVPDKIARKNILTSLLNNFPSKLSSQDIDSISDLAHGYVAADLVNLCLRASMKYMERFGDAIQRQDLMTALTIVRPSAMRELLIEVPNVRWSDIGGQDDLKLKLQQAVEWPLKYGKSFLRLGVKPPGGVLLYGPPGCSKTMIAKALATESGLNFLSIKGPELFSKWVGESEKAVRNLFTKARQVAPSIIFFDEVDAIGGERGTGDAGVHERVLTQLLTELDGVKPLNSVTILAATNRPDKIDTALLRPGRIDRLFYVPLPDYKTRLQILEIKLAKMATSNNVNLQNLSTRTEGFSGAELEALCQEAALKALETDLNCLEVSMENFEHILDDMKPRTSNSVLKLYEEFALG